MAEESAMVRALRIVAPFAGAVVALTAIMLVALLVLRLIFPLVAIPLSLTLPHLDLGEDPSVISVADALEQPYGEVTVTGDLYVQGGRPDRICEQVVTGAAGPRCVGGSLRVVDLENSPQGHALIRDRPASGDVLTEAGVHLYGHLKDGVLIIPPPTMSGRPACCKTDAVNAASYLQRLIDHLVEAARTGVATDDIEGRVESAAAALAAAGLLEQAGVSMWQERALTAMEVGGLIRRLDIESESHTEIAATALHDQRQGPPVQRQERPLPDFIAVVPIGRQIALPGGTTLVLLSVNRWSSGFDLMYATIGRSVAGADRWDWRLVDDVGMSYSVHRWGGGGGDVQLLEVTAFPALPADVRRLTVDVTQAGEPLFSATIDL